MERGIWGALFKPLVFLVPFLPRGFAAGSLPVGRGEEAGNAGEGVI
jgi:hypothetical protein